MRPADHEANQQLLRPGSDCFQLVDARLIVQIHGLPNKVEDTASMLQRFVREYVTHVFTEQIRRVELLECVYRHVLHCLREGCGSCLHQFQRVDCIILTLGREGKQSSSLVSYEVTEDIGI